MNNFNIMTRRTLQMGEFRFTNAVQEMIDQIKAESFESPRRQIKRNVKI